ncbi:hypothetical protein BDV30DRAFT_230486 [Aspergillus minisclerotigenes]|uniref:Uncharacterized protein n=1 Tax=Aspergillus minisclerotigenes TaxID=656917 RepID=A0A5N6IR52_9EURO|nr:hypothetical protein BDV30DRAFT_230486 [Aspergillus minisclerotigenes]
MTKGSEHPKQTLPWSRPQCRSQCVRMRLVSGRIQALFDHSKSVDYITTLSRRPAVWSPWSMARFLSKRSWESNSNITTGKSAYEEKKEDLDTEGKPTCMYGRLPISITVWHVLGVCQVTQSIAIQRYLYTSDVIQSKGYKE